MVSEQIVLSFVNQISEICYYRLCYVIIIPSWVEQTLNRNLYILDYRFDLPQLDCTLSFRGYYYDGSSMSS